MQDTGEILAVVNSANREWIRTLCKLLYRGNVHCPRGKPTRELLNFHTSVDMRYPLVTHNARKMGFRFVFAEALWILNGDNRLETIAPYANAIKNFSDDGYRFQGAYGPKVTEQLRYVTEKLASDWDTRQAVISIWRENPRDSKDIPCTISLQFLIRDHKINCIATMRSSDIWLGWVYDVFNFTMITSWVAMRIFQMTEHRVSLGTLHINAGSQHVYDINRDQVAEVLKQEHDTWSYSPLNLLDYNAPIDLMSHIECLRDKQWDKLRSKSFSELQNLL